MEIIITILLIGIFIVGATIYSSLSWGFVMFKFYGWFLLPIFINLPEITYTQAVGLALFSTLLHSHYSDSIKDDYISKTKQWASFITPWLVLLMGYIIYSWFI